MVPFAWALLLLGLGLAPLSAATRAEAEVVYGAFRVRDGSETFVRRFDVPGVDSSWDVTLGGSLRDGRAFFCATHTGEARARIVFGDIDPSTGSVASEGFEMALDQWPASFAFSPDLSAFAGIRRSSDTDGRLVVLDRSGRSLVDLFMPDAFEIVAWAGSDALLLSTTDWRAYETRYRLPDGSETVTKSFASPFEYRMVVFRVAPGGVWETSLDEIPSFEREFGEGRQALLVLGETRVVALRRTSQSAGEEVEVEWIYHLNTGERIDRGVRIDGVGTSWTTPDPVCYGRAAFVEELFPRRPGGKWEVDVEALPDLDRKNRAVEEKNEFCRAHQRLELVCDGQDFAIEDLSADWHVTFSLPYRAWEFWILSKWSEACGSSPTESSSMRLYAVEKTTRTLHRFETDIAEAEAAPWRFAFDEVGRRIYYAFRGRDGWEVRTITFGE